MKVSEVCFKLGLLFREYSKNSNTPCGMSSRKFSNVGGTSSGKRKRKFDYMEDYDERDSLTPGMGKTMLDIYLDDPKFERKMELDILEFWKANQERYGALSLVAKDILTMPLTTVASESTFSIGGRILNKWRSSYIPENMESLITQSWLFGFKSNGEEEFTGSFIDWNNSNAI